MQDLFIWFINFILRFICTKLTIDTHTVCEQSGKNVNIFQYWKVFFFFYHSGDLRVGAYYEVCVTNTIISLQI